MYNSKKNAQKFPIFDFRAVNKRCVLAEGVVCGTNIIDATKMTLLAHIVSDVARLYRLVWLCS